MRYWQATGRGAVDASLSLTNLAANSTGAWTLQRLNADGSFSDVGTIPAAPGAGMASSGVVTIPAASLVAWGWGVQHFQWVVLAVTPDGSAITPVEALNQGGVALTCSDGLGTIFPPPVNITPDLVSNNLTACPFTIQFP